MKAKWEYLLQAVLWSVTTALILFMTIKFWPTDGSSLLVLLLCCQGLFCITSWRRFLAYDRIDPSEEQVLEKKKRSERTSKKQCLCMSVLCLATVLAGVLVIVHGARHGLNVGPQVLLTIGWAINSILWFREWLTYEK